MTTSVISKSMSAPSNTKLLAITAARDGAVGFRLGSSVTEQRVHIERLLQDGFRVAAAREEVSDAEPVMLLRDDTHGRTDAVCLVRNQAGELVEISVAIQGGIVTGHDDAQAAAAALREQVRAELGAPALELDFVDLWAAEGAFADTQAVAYGACWAATEARATRKAQSASDFQRLMGELPRPLSTVHISTSRADEKLAVVALLSVRE
jgi:hypothetical protein